MQAVSTQDPDLLAIRESLNRLASRLFPHVFENAFKLGYCGEKGGMCKAVDLRTRLPINSDMPWWNLPETVRAAVLLSKLLPELDSQVYMDAAFACLDSTMRFYVRSDLGCLPIQNRSANGEYIDVIPAMPDADPLYHSGLSLIDVVGQV
jgi:mannose/cellobiose epimerase-like protein (N-acyl-D-glucosamine 2-epimerase family)